MQESAVTVEFIGPFRELSGLRRISIPIDGSVSLEQLLDRLSALFGSNFRKRVTIEETGQLNSDQTMVILNGTILPPTRHKDVRIGSGDKVVFAVPLAGGG